MAAPKASISPYLFDCVGFIGILATGREEGIRSDWRQSFTACPAVIPESRQASNNEIEPMAPGGRFARRYRLSAYNENDRADDLRGPAKTRSLPV